MKTIKAWAVADKEKGHLTKEAMPDWGRYWIFETREQARKEVNGRFFNSPHCKLDKIVKVEIKTLIKE